MITPRVSAICWNLNNIEPSITFPYSFIVHLEQIPTSAHIASRMIYTASNTFGDIEGCSVGDLGCGAGMLSIACNLMGSSYTVGFDVDEEALDNAWVNCRKLDIYDIDLVQTDVQSLQLHSGMPPHFFAMCSLTMFGSYRLFTLQYKQNLIRL